MSKTKPAALLVVDDDAGLLRLAAKALAREGHAVQTAGSGAEAIAMLSESLPQLLLLDLKLPDLDAKRVIAKLAELRRLPPFLIITGQGDERVAVEMMKSGALDYLVKDKDFLEFLPSVVSRALRQVEKEEKLAAAEAALRASEERLRVALKHSPVVVFNQDAQLSYTWMHNAPAGHDERFFIGKSDHELYPADEADRLTQIKVRAMATGVGIREEAACTLAGETRFYDLTVEPVRDIEGRITGITCAAMDITERKRLEREVFQISDLEQRRIGQDLHDGICQDLAGIELKCEVLERNLKKSSALAAQAGEIGGQVRNVIAQTRSLARGLSPVVVESEGLMSALTELASRTAGTFGVACRFACQKAVLIADPAVATHLYRIAQEAVTNAMKHGKARAIEISLVEKPENIILTVADDGSGMAPGPAAGKGMGLRIMRYRAGNIGATLLIQRRAAGGTAVVCVLPATAPTRHA